MQCQTARNCQHLHETAQCSASGEHPEHFAVKEEQAFVEGRIIELMPKLAQAEEIDPDESTSRTHVGSTVVVQEDGGAPETSHCIIENLTLTRSLTYANPCRVFPLFGRSEEIDEASHESAIPP